MSSLSRPNAAARSSTPPPLPIYNNEDFDYDLFFGENESTDTDIFDKEILHYMSPMDLKELQVASKRIG